ncbi:hypothetical protein ACFOY2_53780 [Nonomuraea purpurea]|uniref:Uncharacterized protein n=1 Tax=Nonomuraea purpurea TaxID=1849276 RepID=A0ABV8GV27_9ACTN
MDLARRQGAAPELMYVVDLPGYEVSEQSVGVINDDGFCETRRWPCSAEWFGRCGLPGPASNSTQSHPGRHPGSAMAGQGGGWRVGDGGAGAGWLASHLMARLGGELGEVQDDGLVPHF